MKAIWVPIISFNNLEGHLVFGMKKKKEKEKVYQFNKYLLITYLLCARTSSKPGTQL